MTSNSVEPIFIHSLFRSGSTYIYHAVKRTGNYHVYHEPFHEIIGSLPSHWNEQANRTEQLKDLLRHDFLDNGYFDEFAPLLPDIEKYFRPEVSYNLFFLDQSDDSPVLKSYIDCLINSSPNTPVLQCTRTIGRIAWLKQNYNSKNIFLLRNPWDQWFSYKVDSYVSSTPQLIYSQPRLPKVLQGIVNANNYVPLKGENTAEKLNYCLSHPIVPEVDYALFFGLWLFSLLVAHDACDLILDMDLISQEKSEQLQGETNLAKLGLNNIDLSDCNLHRTIFKTGEVSFYQKIEDQVWNIFRQNDQYENKLSTMEEYLKTAREKSFSGSSNADPVAKSILEDASRLRTSLHSTRQDLSQVIHRLQQAVEASTTRLNEKQQEVETLSGQYEEAYSQYKELHAQYNEILNSKAWKLGLFFRAMRMRLAPPGSRLARLIGWLLNSIRIRFGKIMNIRRFRAEMELIKFSGLFDRAWYLKNNPDIEQAKVDPLLHYVKHGGFEGRDPGPKFSSSWYLKNYRDVRDAKINPLVHYVKYGIREGRIALPQLPTARPIASNEKKTGEVVVSNKVPLTVFTICPRSLTAFAKTLFETFRQHHPDAETFLFLCDDIDVEYRKESFPCKIVPLYRLKIPGIDEMARRYNMAELVSAITPYAFSYLFNQLGKDQIIYLDANIIVLSPLQEVVDEFARGTECILSPNILDPLENAEMSGRKMLQVGIYNPGFLALRRTADVLQIVNWWARQILDEDVIPAEGSPVERKWTDLFPAFIKRAFVLYHPGYNVSFSNLSQRTVELVDGTWYSNRQPLRFVHFLGLNPDDPYPFSQHSAILTSTNIGDLNYLLPSIRERLVANGHVEYSKIPYSLRQITAPMMAWTPRILIIDASTPRPDRDAGSVSTFNLLMIYLDLGYDVTFIPSDLLYLGEYTESLRELGVRCLHTPEINNIKHHLEEEGDRYDFVVLCRAHITALHLPDVRLHASDAKIIFDTIDLQHLRQAREAALDGSREKIQAAEYAKEWELDVIRRCDITIVFSAFEAELLKDALDNVDIRVIPLIFVENVYDIPPFDEREDFLFIGGFPHTPNIDAVIYFCTEILPLIRKHLPHVKFHIIGDAPPPQVLELATQGEVIVHGYLKDITSMFRKCKLSVAPLRFGAGIKGKIATSLANGVPVIATKIAVEGMELEAGKHLLVADNPQQFVHSFVAAYESRELWTQLSESGRHQVLQTYSMAAGYRRISRLMQDINPNHKQIDLYTLRSFQEYDLLRKIITEEITERKVIELKLLQHDQSHFFIDGFCAVCGRESKFSTSFMYAHETTDDGKLIPNWREHLNCIRCGFTNRQRATMHILYQRLKPLDTASIYITEQTTPLFKWLKKRHPKLVGSEYLGDVLPFGAEKDGLRNEDLTALTFPDDSFDYVLSFDVMEHVGNEIMALKEIYRCLKPGGSLLFTVPFLKERTKKLVRARVNTDGSVEHILPPEYHSNPVDQENGSLCFRYFAWDIIDDMKSIGFEDPRILNYWSRDFAYLGGEQFIFITDKPIA